MLKRLGGVVLLAAMVPLQVAAFPCHLTVAKDSCWTKYEVSIDVIDLSTNKKLTTIKIPKGQSWGRQLFDCKPKQTLMYEASFLPVIWDADAGKHYRGLNFWNLPNAIHVGEKGWEHKVCYAQDFTQTPIPPEERGNCKCDFTKIPAVKA